MYDIMRILEKNVNTPKNTKIRHLFLDKIPTCLTAGGRALLDGEVCGFSFSYYQAVEKVIFFSDPSMG